MERSCKDLMQMNQWTCIELSERVEEEIRKY